MADVMQNGSTHNGTSSSHNGTSSSHNPDADDSVLLKFQQYRERLRVLGAEGRHDELVAHYDTHAASFSKFFEITGYVGGMMMAESVAKAEPNKDASIMDCGCGDGELGSCLQKLGYTNLTALDPSPAMIEECKNKNIYKNLICDCIRQGHTTNVADGTFDVVAACAVFCTGHMNQTCFPEITRIIKPGGIFLFNIAKIYLKDSPEYNEGKLDAAIQAMVSEGKWQSVSTHTTPYFTSGVVEDCVIYTIKMAEK